MQLKALKKMEEPSGQTACWLYAWLRSLHEQPGLAFNWPRKGSGIIIECWNAPENTASRSAVLGTARIKMFLNKRNRKPYNSCALGGGGPVPAVHVSYQ